MSTTDSPKNSIKDAFILKYAVHTNAKNGEIPDIRAVALTRLNPDPLLRRHIEIAPTSAMADM